MLLPDCMAAAAAAAANGLQEPALLPYLMDDALPLTQLALLWVRRVYAPSQRNQHRQQPLKLPSICGTTAAASSHK
jgi:hypothetical protein